MQHMSEATFWTCIGVVVGWILGICTVALLWKIDQWVSAAFTDAERGAGRDLPRATDARDYSVWGEGDR